MSRVKYLLGIIKSQKAMECCLTMHDLYHYFSGRIVSKWLQLYLCHGAPLPLDMCRFSGYMDRRMDCDDLRDAIYIALLHTRTEMKETIELFRASMWYFRVLRIGNFDVNSQCGAKKITIACAFEIKDILVQCSDS